MIAARTTSASASALRLRAAAAPSPLAARLSLRRSVTVRAEAPESQGPAPTEPVASTSAPAAAAAFEFKLLNPVTEAINGRAAMLGFVAAVVAEATTHQSVASELLGKFDGFGKLVESPFGDLPFAAVVVMITMATLAPKLVDNVEVGSKSFGPFTPSLESIMGRAAMLGFLGLIVVELIKGSSLL